ncbi:MAG: ABC transporter ATP-binding protein [Nitrososphaeria archaeon]|nr:ABC transporter ATP-binding protein [Nitrososphaeria archaeon]
MVEDNAILKLENVKTYFFLPKGLFKTLVVKAVDGVSLEMKRGESLAIVGESGSGKTTLGRTAIRLIEPTEGRIIFDGKDITHMSDEKEMKMFRRSAQIIFQDPFMSLNPYMTIREILEEPLIIHGYNDAEERKEIIVKSLIDVKLQPPEEFLLKYPHMLSGGQRQRVGIARAMVLNPKFIVADEPVSMIDASSRAEILYLFKSLQEKYNLTFMYITHDIATAKYFSDNLAVMYLGKIVEYGSTREVILNPKHPYTSALITAVPDPDPKNRFIYRKVISGEIPSAVNPPQGCRFHTRCPYKFDPCDKSEPSLIQVNLNHMVACHLYNKK